jgi:hypothetical protein
VCNKVVANGQVCNKVGRVCNKVVANGEFVTRLLQMEEFVTRLQAKGLQMHKLCCKDVQYYGQDLQQGCNGFMTLNKVLTGCSKVVSFPAWAWRM